MKQALKATIFALPLLFVVACGEQQLPPTANQTGATGQTGAQIKQYDWGSGDISASVNQLQKSGINQGAATDWAKTIDQQAAEFAMKQRKDAKKAEKKARKKAEGGFFGKVNGFFGKANTVVQGVQGLGAVAGSLVSAAGGAQGMMGSVGGGGGGGGVAIPPAGDTTGGDVLPPK